MSEIDIRNTSDTKIDKIIFADEGFSYVTAASLRLIDDHFRIYDEDGGESLIIESKTQAENLIKALHKAIELNWVV